MPSIIIGANHVLDPDTLMAKTDVKGRNEWNMPKPIRFVEHLQIVKKLVPQGDGRVKVVKVKELVEFPVYRGVDTKYARWVRAQVKRDMRKAEEARLAAEAEKAEELKFEL